MPWKLTPRDDTPQCRCHTSNDNTAGQSIAVEEHSGCHRVIGVSPLALSCLVHLGHNIHQVKGQTSGKAILWSLPRGAGEWEPLLTCCCLLSFYQEVSSYTEQGNFQARQTLLVCDFADLLWFTKKVSKGVTNYFSELCLCTLYICM